MSHTVKKMTGIATSAMNKLEDTVSGGSSTSKTLFSKMADPLRIQRQQSAAGAGTKPADWFDPNNQLHAANQNTDANRINNDNQIAAQQAADLYAATPRAPSQNVAANSSQQQADYLRRRRGVLSNIFGGNQANSSPVAVASKSLLGS